MRVLDWPSRALLAAFAALVAFALTGASVRLDVVEQGVALAPASSPSSMDPAQPAPNPFPSPTVPLPTTPTPAPTATADSTPAADPTPEPVTIAFTGDIHGEPPIADVLRAGGNPLAAMATILSAADVAVVNLETAVGTGGTPQDKAFTFQADPALADALAEAGVDIASMANNHALDHGREAAEETASILRAAGLATIGWGPDATAAYAPEVVEVGGQTIAFVGLTRVLHTLDWVATADRSGLASAYDRDRAVRAVRDAAAVADHVVVVIHWGQERHTCPNGDQLALARAFAEAGADVVVGHHPHVLQGIDDVEGTLVAYSLGNFSFYARRVSQRLTGVLTVTLDPGGVAAHRWDPAYIDGRGQPEPVPTQADIPVESGTVTNGSVGCGPPRP